MFRTENLASITRTDVIDTASLPIIYVSSVVTGGIVYYIKQTP